MGESGHGPKLLRGNDENIIWGSPPFGIVYLRCICETGESGD